MDSLISVIVPIYNVEQYLRQCLDSIVSQSYNNLEIILVDDGSPDRCPQVCDEYAKKDSRIKVIHKQNGGLSSARNAGLDIATGEYIAFVDSDDWLELDIYEKLIKSSLKYDADIVECAFREIPINVINDIDVRKEDVSSFFSYPEIIQHIVSSNIIPKLRFEVWDKLYKRQLIDKTRFKVGQIYEDLFFEREVFKRCNKLIYINEIGYNYRINRDGSTVTFFNEKKLCKFDELDEYIKDFDRIGDLELVKELCVFGCASAIDLYYSSKMFGGSKSSRKTIMSFFKKYKKRVAPCPNSYTLFSISPTIYFYIRSLLH